MTQRAARGRVAVGVLTQHSGAITHDATQHHPGAIEMCVHGQTGLMILALPRGLITMNPLNAKDFSSTMVFAIALFFRSNFQPRSNSSAAIRASRTSHSE